MLLTNALVATATLASAVPGATTPSHIHARQNETEKGSAPPFFKLQVLAITTPIHLQHFQADLSSIFVGLPQQNATCNNTPDQPTEQEATFALGPEDNGLYLYGASATPQELYADRSGMGQGKLGYTTGAQPAPINAERTGWVVDEAGNLSLDGAGFIACPNSIDGSWSVWVNAGVANPAGNTDCVGISARAVAIPTPVGCSYSF
ncbi:cell wall protein PhiA [Colletotrichum graminicola]|uniref:Cell wall protein PhiA n=2 Tax=Colletotrichum graminicola TaxID=31870 RepID=E3QG75_COLGM|nr:cell wall protein PhiA [Colletotrichum graminicola M1.001]EFQ29671.1 cell wall protein PhiA [Colletotrichum graminicola M1.001]WDK12581.1 cell wall protein PhiA [Colletotrichum graminicola]